METKFYLKNIVFALLCILFGYYLGFTTSSAQAEELVNFKFSTNLVNSSGYDFSDELNQIVDKLNQSNKKYFIYLKADQSTGYYTDIRIRQLNDTNSSYSYRIDFYNIYRYVFFKDISRAFTSTHSNKISYEEMNDILTNIDDETRWSSWSNNSTGSGYMTLFQQTDRDYAEWILYASNYLENKTDYNLCFNEVCTLPGDKLVLPHDILSRYTENFKTFTKNIDRVEYTFDIPLESFRHEFNFSATWSYQGAENYPSYFVRPYLSRELASMTELLYFDDKTTQENEVTYYATQMNRFNDTVGLKFIVDFTNINAFDDSTMFIHFDSNYAFTRNVIETTETPTPPTPPVVDDKDQTIIDQNKEAETTRKGILASILDLPSKIVNGLLDALKSLFLPSSDFFETFINDFKDNFLDKLGFLAYPFELLGDLLGRFMNLETNPVINIPEIHEPFTGGVLISATSFNLLEIFEHGAIGTFYDIYISFVSVIFIFMFMNYSIKKYNEFVKNQGGGN